MIQQLGPLGQIDAVTSGELKESMGHHFELQQREIQRGKKLMRMTPIRAVASAATLTLFGNPNDGLVGPEQGYFWRIQRIIVASNSITDVAKYVLYYGSDPTAIDQIHLLDAIVGGATPGQSVNVAYSPANRSAWLFGGEQVYAAITGATSGNTYSMTGIVSEVPAEMIGKLV